MWTEAKALGFPSLGGCGGLRLGRTVAWLPGMRANGIADWYAITWHTGDLKRYVAAGGDMSRVIVHFLTYDEGVIAPLWGKKSFHERVKKMREFGVRAVVAPDFSSWADFPVVVQLHNYYRSAVVSADLARAGFAVVPNVCWSSPATYSVSIGMWSDAQPGTIVIDANHSTDKEIDRRLFWAGARVFVDAWTKRQDDVVIWSSTRAMANKWNVSCGPCSWVPSRSAMLAGLVKRRKSWQKEAVEAEAEAEAEEKAGEQAVVVGATGAA